ncbi:heme o synthase [Sneathiella glossodoripedis]|uniref:heme o synthase n=1 Tax=Sneathiella glossodoripedis TaxID=418853 RepID=UPI000472C547|nr:heme o synthase [Sneathiella glossodoripedis]
MSDTSIIQDNAARTVYQTARASDYFALLKPRVMSLVVFTGLVGLVVAPGDLHPVLAFTALLCIAVGAGASGAINMWYDADIDQIMERTQNRPIPAGKVTAGEALGIGVALSVASVVLMGLAVNLVAAALLALTIGFYIFIYTMWLKRRTPQNIVIGGAAGAFPPMIGWAAVTGSVSIESLVLFAVIFFWTPPHFWALSLWRDIDYANAGVPMLPVVSGREATRRQIVFYSILLLPIGVSPYLLGFAGPVYGVGSALLGAIFLFGAFKVWFKKDEKSAKQLFAFSLLYLFLIFALLLGEAIVMGIV